MNKSLRSMVGMWIIAPIMSDLTIPKNSNNHFHSRWMMNSFYSHFHSKTNANKTKQIQSHFWQATKLNPKIIFYLIKLKLWISLCLFALTNITIAFTIAITDDDNQSNVGKTFPISNAMQDTEKNWNIHTTNQLIWFVLPSLMNK